MTIERHEPAEPSMLNPATDSAYMVLHDVAEYARLIADSDMVQPELRGSVGRVAAVILYGRALGMDPMIALRTINVIKGRPSLNAEGMRALVFAAGHEIEVDENTSSRAIVRGRRKDRDTWTKVEWTSADAQRAGLAGNNQWKSYPRAMLLARASTELCRMIFADVVTGLVVAEEQDDYVAEGKTESSAAPVAAPRREPVRRAPKKSADPVPADTPELEAPQNATQGQPEDTPPPPARQRPTIKPRGFTPEAPPEGQIIAGPDPDEFAAFTAEKDEPEQPFIPPGRATEGQVTAIVMHLERLGVKDHDTRVTTVGLLIGRRVASTKDVDDDEAAKLIDQLAHLRNAAALEAVIKDQP